jgi:hypothetical protein
MGITHDHRSRLRRGLGLVAVVAALLTGLGTGFATPAGAANALENQYKVTGTWAVTQASISDSAGNPYTVWYPTNLGANGYDHPIITWGNGTGSPSTDYQGILTHMASWGAVVISTNSTTTGYGTEMLAGVNHLIAKNADASSIFYQKLDTAKVGAMGHSQGAGGAINAALDSGGVIKSVLTVSLPNEDWIGAEHKFDLTQLTVPIFFVSGTLDWISNASHNQFHYNKAAKAAKGLIKNAGHSNIEDPEDDTLGNPTPYKGYLNAWFLYTLSGNTTARGVFAGSTPELPTNTAWANQALKNLP